MALPVAYGVAALVGMFIFGAIGHYIGKTYRNQPVSGFWFGFWLGAIGLVLIVILDDKRRKCPACGERISGSPSICPDCKSPLTKIHRKKKRRSKYDEPDRLCGKCKKVGVLRVTDGGTITVCPECGEQVF